MEKEITDYIKTLKIPSYHSIIFQHGKLIMSYQNLYLCGDIVFNNFDTVIKVSLNRFNLNTFEEIKILIDKFIENGRLRSLTKPFQIQRLNDIDNDGTDINFWDFNYCDSGMKDRYLAGEGRHNDKYGGWSSEHGAK